MPQLPMLGKGKEYHLSEKEETKDLQRSFPITPKVRKEISLKIQCYGCSKLGHYRKDCPNMKEEDKKKFNYKRHHAHAVEDDAPKKKEKKKHKSMSYTLLSQEL